MLYDLRHSSSFFAFSSFCLRSASLCLCGLTYSATYSKAKKRALRRARR